MPRPGPRPYECVRRAWHSDKHQPLRGSITQEIFRVVTEIHKAETRAKKEWQEKLPTVVLRAEEILYSKARSEEEYTDVKTLDARLKDAVDTMIRRTDSECEGKGPYMEPCVEAALSLGCSPKTVPRGQRSTLSRQTFQVPPRRNEAMHTANISSNSRHPILNQSYMLQRSPAGSFNFPLKSIACPWPETPAFLLPSHSAEHARIGCVSDAANFPVSFRDSYHPHKPGRDPLFRGASLPIGNEELSYPHYTPGGSVPSVTPSMVKCVDPKWAYPDMQWLAPGDLDSGSSTISRIKKNAVEDGGSTSSICLDPTRSLGVRSHLNSSKLSYSMPSHGKVPFCAGHYLPSVFPGPSSLVCEDMADSGRRSNMVESRAEMSSNYGGSHAECSSAASSSGDFDELQLTLGLPGDFSKLQSKNSGGTSESCITSFSQRQSAMIVESCPRKRVSLTNDPVSTDLDSAKRQRCELAPGRGF